MAPMRTCKCRTQPSTCAAPALVYHNDSLHGTREYTHSGPRALPICSTEVSIGHVRRDVWRNKKSVFGSKNTGLANASAALMPSSNEYQGISSPNPRPPLSIGRGIAGASSGKNDQIASRTAVYQLGSGLMRALSQINAQMSAHRGHHLYSVQQRCSFLVHSTTFHEFTGWIIPR